VATRCKQLEQLREQRANTKNNASNYVQTTRQQTRATYEQGKKIARLINKVQTTSNKQGMKVAR
jgi:hypothetical protein